MTVDNKKFIGLYIVGAFINCLAGIPHLGYYTISGIQHGWYYILQALSFVLLCGGTYYYDKNNCLSNRIFRIVIWLTFSNLLDELFFNPLKLGYNEIVFAVFISTYELFKWRKDEQHTRKEPDHRNTY